MDWGQKADLRFVDINTPMGWYRAGEFKDITHATIKAHCTCMERPNLGIMRATCTTLSVGSGTTIIAAERQGRTCYAMEIEPKPTLTPRSSVGRTTPERLRSMHLQIEASGGQVEKLEQPYAISAYLHRLTDLAGMSPIAEPLIVQLPAGGLAGVLVLAESHASIHTVLGQAWIDLFSCRELPIDPARNCSRNPRDIRVCRHLLPDFQERVGDTSRALTFD